MAVKLSEFQNIDQIPIVVRKEIRQLVCLGIGLELAALYMPSLIAPNIPTLLEEIKITSFEKFMCICGKIVRSEQSWRCHITDKHRQLMEFFTVFAGIASKLQKLDLRYLGNTS